MSRIGKYHASGQAVDDAVPFISLAIGQDGVTAQQRAEVIRLLHTNDGPRVAACIEILAAMASSFLEVLCDHTGDDPHKLLQWLALMDQRKVPR